MTRWEHFAILGISTNLGEADMPDEPTKATQLECTIAAILTHAALGTEGHSAQFALNKYVQILGQLRLQGGPVHPTEAH
jgi:hypothetical protein